MCFDRAVPVPIDGGWLQLLRSSWSLLARESFPFQPGDDFPVQASSSICPNTLASSEPDDRYRTSANGSDSPLDRDPNRSYFIVVVAVQSRHVISAYVPRTGHQFEVVCGITEHATHNGGENFIVSP